MKTLLAVLVLAIVQGGVAQGAERAVDPTYYRVRMGSEPARATPLTSAGCQTQAIFGEGSPRTAAMRGLARFARVVAEAGAACAAHAFAGEEQTWFVVKGAGAVNGRALRAEDFVYVPVNQRVELRAEAGGIEVLVFGYKTPGGRTGSTELQIANTGEVKKQVVGNHPPSTLYQLLVGDTRSTRDRMAAGAVLTSLFVMDMAPGGTNFPHHHDREEELYVVLEGQGEMVAGGGAEGVEGRVASKAGDAYYFRLNTTVGFYNTGGKQARILAARWLYPFGGARQ